MKKCWKSNKPIQVLRAPKVGDEIHVSYGELNKLFDVIMVGNCGRAVYLLRKDKKEHVSVIVSYNSEEFCITQTFDDKQVTPYRTKNFGPLKVDVTKKTVALNTVEDVYHNIEVGEFLFSTDRSREFEVKFVGNEDIMILEDRITKQQVIKTMGTGPLLATVAWGPYEDQV